MALYKSMIGALVLISLGVSISSATYKAAVVEFYPDQFHTADQRIQNNLKGFEKALDTVRRIGGIDIVIFPEDAILGELYFTRDQIAPYLEAVPDVTPTSNKVTPCTDSAFKDRPILRKLSCLAQDYQVVLVANMGDIQPCSVKHCPKDGKYHFNTNVVFEADGTLIAKYHKLNLYAGEAKYFDPGSYSNNTCVSFDTSFGVTFGTFTCYDLLFKEPANCLLSKNIKNFVLPTAWGSSYPFYMSIAVQQGWSRKHRVNFLAANQHFKLSYSTGSGLYSNGVAKHYIISGDSWPVASGQVIVADLSEDPSTTLANTTQLGNVSNVKIITSKINTYLNFTLLDTKEGSVETSYLDTTHTGKDLICRLEYTVKTSPKEERYALGAYIGTSVDDSQFQFAVCTLVKCTSSGKCGAPADDYQAATVFDKVILSGTFADGSEVYATALGSNLALLSASFLELGTNSATITGYDQPLIAASLWSRVYDD